MTELTLYLFAITLVLLGGMLGGMAGYFYAYYEIFELYKEDPDDSGVLDAEEIS